MGQAAAAARVDDPFGHSSAMSGVLVGLAVGALIGVAILATGGLGAIAIGAAIATTGGAGLAGQVIGQTIPGPDTGQLKIGSPTIIINGKPATMTVLASGRCDQDSGGPRLVASGSASVLFHRQPAARVGERMDCSAVIRRGSPNVVIGGPTAQVLDVEPEVPTWLTTTMTAMAIGGTLIATGGIAATYGVGAAAGSLIGGVGGGYLGGHGGAWAAAQMGFGETGQAVGGVLGGLAGGMLGGGLGFRGGQAAGNRFGPGSRTPPVAPDADAAVSPTARVAASGADDIPGLAAVDRPVYRVDGRPPGTIYDEGFQPRGTSRDLESYVNTNQPSTYISTSKTPAIAENPAFGQPGKHLYEIDGAGLRGVDVNKAYPNNPFANESEIAIPGGIPRESIIGSKPILPGGGLGETVPNPFYKGGQ